VNRPSKTKCTVLLVVVTAGAVFTVTLAKKSVTLEFVIGTSLIEEEAISIALQISAGHNHRSSCEGANFHRSEVIHVTSTGYLISEFMILIFRMSDDEDVTIIF
jgi:hypothetical protein